MPYSPDIFTVRYLNLASGQSSATSWIRGAPFESQWFNALSIRLPGAERYGIDVIKEALPIVQDPGLRQRAKGFIAQEAIHSNLHNQCNETLEKAGLGLSMPKYTGWRFRIAGKMHYKHGLAMTVAWEHFTAIICEHALRHSDFMSRGEEPFSSLWVWHCVEELEHRCLAQDLYTACGGGRFIRAAWYLYATLLFASDFTVQVAVNCVRSKEHSLASTCVDAFRYLFGKKGLAWFGIPRWCIFFSRKYHPRDDDVEALISEALSSLDGRYRVIGNGPA